MKKRKQSPNQPDPKLRRNAILLASVCIPLILYFGYFGYYFIIPTIESWNCLTVPSEEPTIRTGTIDFDARDFTTSSITLDNISQVEQVGTFYLNRDRFETERPYYQSDVPITHPNVDYVLYPFRGATLSTMTVCDGDLIPKAVIHNDTILITEDIIFAPNSEMFAMISHESVRMFDAHTLEELPSINLSGHVWDIAIHPDVPLIAITFIEEIDHHTYYHLTIWDYETQTEMIHIRLDDYPLNIRFNSEGTAIINYSSAPNTPVYIWGIPSE